MSRIILILLVLPLMFKISVADEVNINGNSLGEKSVIVNESDGANKINSENITNNKNTSISESNIYIDNKTITNINEKNKKQGNKKIDLKTKFSKMYPQLSSMLGIHGCGNEHRRTVNHKKGYSFHNSFDNDTDKNIFLNNFFVFLYDSNGNELPKDRSILDGGGDWQWTQEVRDANYIIKAHSSIKAIETGKTKDRSEYWNWIVVKKPSNSKKPNYYDFGIQYITVYDLNNTPNKRRDDKAVLSCVFYKIE